MKPGLLVLFLAFCCAAPISAADDPADAPPDTPASDGVPGPVMLDDLAVWRSPVAGPLLTDGEYQVVSPTIRQRIPLSGAHRQVLVVVPFETPSGDEALSIAVLERAGDGYRSHFLANALADELHSVRPVRLGSGTPKVMVTERGGSGGFLTMRVFGASREGQWRTVWMMPGVYQGKYRLQGETARVHRYIAGTVDAYPKAVWRETYVWGRGGFRRASRQRVRLKTPPGPGDTPRRLHARGVD